MPESDPIARLASQIDATEKAERFATDAPYVAALRRRGACDLHAICADFVSSVNSKLSQATLDLAPPSYTPEMFRESGANLIRISSQGRELQITFASTPRLVSTEKFVIPYILEGELRTYNQRMLERFEIRSQPLFLCLEDDKAVWRFFDWRTKRTGPVDSVLLVDLMGRLF